MEGPTMKEPLSTSKLIRDLGGRLPEAFFGAAWDERNKIDIARARELHRDAVNKANAPKLLLELVQEEPDRPDSDFVNYDVERMKDAEEDFGEGDGE
jgi:hypothetical protein